MSVKKFRDVSEMEGNTWYEPGDPRLFEAIRAVWDLADRITQPHFPPGVYKHRSIEEAEALRESWDRANFEAFHARRRENRADAGEQPSEASQPGRRQGSSPTP